MGFEVQHLQSLVHLLQMRCNSGDFEWHYVFLCQALLVGFYMQRFQRTHEAMCIHLSNHLLPCVSDDVLELTCHG